MRKYIYLIMVIFSNYIYANVVSEKESSVDGIVNYVYRTDSDNIFRCKNKDCDLIFNKSNNYCRNLESLKDELESDIRMRWICPKIYAFSDLYKKYKIRLSNDPSFSDYILNLYRIMDNSEYSIFDGRIKINNFSLQVGMSPDAFFIPGDINDVIKSIIIKFDKQGFVTEEYYVMENGDNIFRSYKYKDSRVVEIATKKINNRKVIYKSISYFNYD